MNAEDIGIILMALSLAGMVYEMVIQNRLMQAQLLKDRFEMYWNVYSPISADRVADLDTYPEDYMERARYERDYRGNPKAASKYLKMSDLYDYLAFCHQLKLLKIKDPLGDDWTEKNVRDYMKEKEFMEVQDYYGRTLYPDFARFVDGLAGRRGGR